MKFFMCLGVLLLATTQVSASGTRYLNTDLSEQMNKKEMKRPVSLKTFKCHANEKLITCTRRFKKEKQMMENN